MKVGVFVDGGNMLLNGGQTMDYAVLRQYAETGGHDAAHLNIYVSFDEERAQTDSDYRTKQHRFHSYVRSLGYKVIEKPVKWYYGADSKEGKSNVDLDMAVDILLSAERLDKIILLTGDGDFTKVVTALQQKGCRVEVIAFKNISVSLQRECDFFMSGYMIPDFINRADEKEWGEDGSVVYGVCDYFCTEKQFGYLRFYKQISAEGWKQDSRIKGTPYEQLYVSGKSLRNIAPGLIKSDGVILQFKLNPSSSGELREASDVQVAYNPYKKS
ncbi:LabA-like NYN domain-containing protein [Thiomicrolovo sp. ZZH C-3]